MSTRAQVGTLVLADISGFTTFLAQTELEHAHNILAELLHLVIDRLPPALTLAEVEGDCVFAYAPADAFPRGQALLDLVEHTYASFIGRVEAIGRQSRFVAQHGVERPAPVLMLQRVEGLQPVGAPAGSRDLFSRRKSRGRPGRGRTRDGPMPSPSHPPESPSKLFGRSHLRVSRLGLGETSRAAGDLHHEEEPTLSVL